MAFRKPQQLKIGGKFLAFGLSGEGKSFFSLTFPNSAVIDSETGMSFYEGKDIHINNKSYNNIKLVDTTSDLDTLEEDLDSIIEGELSEIETLVIDSETKFYNTMDIGCTEEEERKAKLAGKNVDTRAKWGRVKNINMKLQQAKITASAKGIHIVSTAQGKEITDDNNKLIGYAPDMHKSAKFDYDVVLRFYTETDKTTKQIKHFAEVIKDRTEVTTVGSIIEDCTYDVWKDYFDKRNNLESNNANFTQDLKNSVQSVMSNAELSGKLAEELKGLLKSKTTKDNQIKIKAELDRLQISIKEMDVSEPNTLKEMIKFLTNI